MKRILACLSAALFAFGASAATLLPIQLLNPAGSTSGQTIVSTGTSTAPAWGGVPISGLSAIAANTVLANATGSSASPTAFAMPSCATALEWTAGTGFVCNTAGAFTTLSASGTVTVPSGTTFNQPIIKGETNGSSAVAGQIGERITNSNTAISLTNGAPFNAASITLTAGDWDVSGTISFINGAGASSSVMNASISLTSVTQNTAIGWMTSSPNVTTTAVTTRMSTPVVPISVTTTTIVYLVGVDTFAGGTVTSDGLIRATRAPH